MALARAAAAPLEMAAAGCTLPRALRPAEITFLRGRSVVQRHQRPAPWPQNRVCPRLSRLHSVRMMPIAPLVSDGDALQNARPDEEVRNFDQAARQPPPQHSAGNSNASAAPGAFFPVPELFNRTIWTVGFLAHSRPRLLCSSHGLPKAGIKQRACRGERPQAGAQQTIRLVLEYNNHRQQADGKVQGLGARRRARHSAQAGPAAAAGVGAAPLVHASAASVPAQSHHWGSFKHLWPMESLPVQPGRFCMRL